MLRRGDGWDDFAHLFGGVWLPRRRRARRALGRAARSRVRSAPTSGAGSRSTRRARRLRPRDGPGLGATGRAARRARVARRRDRRRRRRRQRLAARRAPAPAAGLARDRLRPARDQPRRGRARRPHRVRRRRLLRARPRGDVYVLATILHDWDDERAAAILRTIRAAAPGRRAAARPRPVVQPGNEPHGAKWLDLLMLALFAGRERDEAQWRALLATAGFEPVQHPGRPDRGAMPLTVGTAGPHRPRQDVARPGADRQGHRPAARGAAARDLDRPRLRAARARRTAAGCRSSTCPGTSASSARWSPGRPASTSSCSSSTPARARARRRTSTSRSCACSASSAASSR